MKELSCWHYAEVVCLTVFPTVAIFLPNKIHKFQILSRLAYYWSLMLECSLKTLKFFAFIHKKLATLCIRNECIFLSKPNSYVKQKSTKDQRMQFDDKIQILLMRGGRNSKYYALKVIRSY